LDVLQRARLTESGLSGEDQAAFGETQAELGQTGHSHRVMTLFVALETLRLEQKD
jgi:hypothetical protein